MSALRFEWDDRKATANASKHGVTFDEARSVFFDERARLIDDQTIPTMRIALFCLALAVRYAF